MVTETLAGRSDLARGRPRRDLAGRDVAGALAEAALLHFPGYLYGPLLRAVCLAELGLDAEAAGQLATALELRPELLDDPAAVLGEAPTIPPHAVEHLVARLAAVPRAG